MENPELIIAKIPAFVRETEEEAKEFGMNISSFEIDHVCCRCETLEQYKVLRKSFLTVGKLLSEAIISGRPISTFKLANAIEIGKRRIDLVEIPAPKADAHYHFGLEHIECVIPHKLSEFVAAYPDFNFDLRGANKSLNPEIALTLPSGKTVKFHNMRLDRVIELEKN